MLKPIIGVGIAGVVIALAAPLVSGMFDRDNEASRLVSAADRTNHQAGDLGESYTEIVPLTDEEGNPVTPDPDRQKMDDKYEQYTSPAEHEVRDAMEFLRKLQTEAGPVPQTEYIKAVQQLKAAWQPRYDKAAADYKVFAYRIHHAEEMAKDYFEVQARLTNQIINDQQRRQAELQDFRERDIYLEWRTQAHATLASASLIKQDLDDLNVVITKLELSANFAALYQDFRELPPSLLNLHAEIDKFQSETVRIQNTFGAGSWHNAPQLEGGDDVQ